jgi:hypothetical protein
MLAFPNGRKGWKEAAKGTMPFSHGCVFPPNRPEHTTEILTEEYVPIGDGPSDGELNDGLGRDVENIGEKVLDDSEVDNRRYIRVNVHDVRGVIQGAKFGVDGCWEEEGGPRSGSEAKNGEGELAGSIRRRLLSCVVGDDRQVRMNEGMDDSANAGS